ncbi:DNA alkylation repair protein [Thioclava sp. SK-1]|uniref:DNA alkylation repair protein n=1 Tax=Thioclava sp. SK-1 TaxID=1889770 RepID=UPI00159F2DFB|nr:DNA alkylation repair protein [Thioclava sp. SK-1]
MARKRGGGHKAQVLRDDGERLSPEEEARLTAELESYVSSDADYEYFAEDEDAGDVLPPPTFEDVIYALEAWKDDGRADQLHTTQGVDRRYIGVAPAGLDDLVAMWRGSMDVEARVDLARALWDSDIFEARLVATRLLFQARLRPDDVAWAMIQGWIFQMDCPALTEAVCKTAAKRVQADAARLDQLELWFDAADDTIRSAAFRVTLPWAKLRNLKDDDIAVQDRILGWVVTFGAEAGPALRLSMSQWLRAYLRHAPERGTAWAQGQVDALAPGVRREIARLLNIELTPS